MPNIKQSKSIAKDHIPAALKVMEEEYVKENRVKLTHFWLAERLGITNHIAFVVLANIAQKKKFCRRIPNGPIYWDNDLIKVGELLDALVGNKQQEEPFPKHRDAEAIALLS